MSEFHLHMQSLLELTQTGTVAEYTAMFWEHLHRVLHLNSTLSIKCFVPQYIDGLREDIQAAVWSRSPTSITGASCLARIREDEVVKEAAPAAEKFDDGHGHGVQGLTPTEILTDVSHDLAAPVVRGADHNVIVINPNNLAAPTPNTCSTECPSHDATVDIFPKSADSVVRDEAIDIDTFSVMAPTAVTFSMSGLIHGDINSFVAMQMLRPPPWPSFVAEDTTVDVAEAWWAHGSNDDNPVTFPVMRLAPGVQWFPFLVNQVSLLWQSPWPPSEQEQTSDVAEMCDMMISRAHANAEVREGIPLQISTRQFLATGKGQAQFNKTEAVADPGWNHGVKGYHLLFVVRPIANLTELKPWPDPWTSESSGGVMNKLQHDGFWMPNLVHVLVRRKAGASDILNSYTERHLMVVVLELHRLAARCYSHVVNLEIETLKLYEMVSVSPNITPRTWDPGIIPFGHVIHILLPFLGVCVGHEGTHDRTNFLLLVYELLHCTGYGISFPSIAAYQFLSALYMVQHMSEVMLDFAKGWPCLHFLESIIRWFSHLTTFLPRVDIKVQPKEAHSIVGVTSLDAKGNEVFTGGPHHIIPFHLPWKILVTEPILISLSDFLDAIQCSAEKLLIAPLCYPEHFQWVPAWAIINGFKCSPQHILLLVVANILDTSYNPCVVPMRECVPTYLDYSVVVAFSLGLRAGASTWMSVLMDIWHVHYLSTLIEWIVCLSVPVVRCSLGNGSDFTISGIVSTALPVEKGSKLNSFRQFWCGLRLWNPGIRGAAKTFTKQFGIHNNSSSPYDATGTLQSCTPLIYTRWS